MPLLVRIRDWFSFSERILTCLEERILATMPIRLSSHIYGGLGETLIGLPRVGRQEKGLHSSDGLRSKTIYAIAPLQHLLVEDGL